MNEQFLKNIRVIKAAIAERKLVIFAGAGISIDAGAPTWSELTNQLKKDIDIPEYETDFLRIAQLYYNERQQKEFIDKVREVLNHKKLRYNEIHEALFKLNPEHIVTTNFDDLLEQVIKSKAYPYSIIKKDTEFPYARNTKLLVKIHGDLDEANLVIKEDDYLEYSSTHPLFESFIKGIFSTKVVLFVGYSFSDFDLKIILQSVRNILGRDFQNAYLLSVEKEYHPSQREYLRNKGINVVNYYDGGTLLGYDFIHQYLYFGRNALRQPSTRINNSLSEKGNRLLDLLSFILKYYDFAEYITEENPLSQMVKSLDRFSNIRTLPPKFLGNLYPFNSSKRYIHNYYGYTLASNNEKITDFFFKDVESETLTLKDTFFEKYSIPISQRNNYDKQLETVLQKLNYSTIFFFGKSNKTIELFDHPKELDEKISISLPNKHCTCLSCQYNELNFKGFLKDIKEQSITETSDIQSDMLTAYSNYKAGNIKTSINQFEETANKAWQLEEYIPYFICQHNIKILKYLLNWELDDENRESSQHLAERLEDLDLDKLMFQVPKLNDDVYTLLKKIRDDEVLISAERTIVEVHEKIVDVYNLYKEGKGFTWGPYYPVQILEEFIKVFSFYTYNYIVKDEFLEYRRIFKKGIDALLISYAIDKKYKGRFQEFDAWLIRFILLYADSKDLKETIKQYSIQEIDVREEEISTIIRFLNNLFASIFKETNFLGREVKLQKEILIQSKNFLFQQNLRTTIQNAFLIYSIIPIPEQFSRPIVKNFLDFLQVDESFVLGTDDYFIKFLKKIIDFFSYEQLLELLKISSRKKVLIRSHEFFRLVADTIKEKHKGSLIEEEELLDTIITKSIKPKKGQHERGFMHLWPVASERNRRVISETIKADFSTNFYAYDYFVASALGVIKPSDFYSEILRKIGDALPREFNPDEETSIHSDYNLSNFLHMIYGRGLIYDQVPYSNFDELPDYAKFFFRPFSFDYCKFNVQWLLFLNHRVFLQHLYKIPQVKAALENALAKEKHKELREIYTSLLFDSYE